MSLDHSRIAVSRNRTKRPSASSVLSRECAPLYVFDSNEWKDLTALFQYNGLVIIHNRTNQM